LKSVSTAHYYVDKLSQDGYLSKEANDARSIQLGDAEFIESPYMAEMGLDSVSIPLVGSADCGPAEMVAEENVEGYLKVSRRILNKMDGVIALRARGDSMNLAKIGGRNIEDGDFVLVDTDYRNPRSGDLVLSVIDGHANLKRFRIDRKTRQIKLMPESSNSRHKPIFVSSEDDYMINGKVIAVLKK
jgi:SOS-response transcriptional repressor LexA